MFPCLSSLFVSSIYLCKHTHTHTQLKIAVQVLKLLVCKILAPCRVRARTGPNCLSIKCHASGRLDGSVG